MKKAWLAVIAAAIILVVAWQVRADGGPHGVIVVAQDTLVSSTVSIPATVIDTPKTDTVYNITINLNHQSTDNTGAVHATLSFTSLWGQPVSFPFDCTGSGNCSTGTSGSVVVAAGSPITLTVDYVPGVSGSPYNLFYSFTRM